MLIFCSRYRNSAVSPVSDISGGGEKTLLNTFFCFQHIRFVFEFFKKNENLFPKRKG